MTGEQSNNCDKGESSEVGEASERCGDGGAASGEAQRSSEPASPGAAAIAACDDGRDVDFSKLNAQEELERARELNARLEAEVAEAKDKYLRALAEIENYKKRVQRERSELLKYQGEALLLDILPAVDNFELALQHKDADADKLRAGIELIHKMLVDGLQKWGVRPESALGKPFNPQIHSALSRVAVDDAPPGTVVNELRKAYFYKDKLLRPAEVVVSAARDASAETSSGSAHDGSVAPGDDGAGQGGGKN